MLYPPHIYPLIPYHIYHLPYHIPLGGLGAEKSPSLLYSRLPYPALLCPPLPYAILPSPNHFHPSPPFHWPGAVARSEASSLGMQAAPSSIPTSGTFFRGDLVMKTFLRPFSLFRWFKTSSCQLLAKECALSTGKLPRRLAKEQCG